MTCECRAVLAGIKRSVVGRFLSPARPGAVFSSFTMSLNFKKEMPNSPQGELTASEDKASYWRSLMKSQRTYLSAVVGLTLLTCSFALAGETEGPFIGHASEHTLSRPMREYSPAQPEIAVRLSLPAITG